MNAATVNPDAQTLDGVAFIGDTLGVLLFHDPADGAVQTTYRALGTLDPANAAHEWPFVTDEEARDALQLIVEGLSNGVDEEIIWEYRRLFVGPDAKAAPPWGSVYTDKECVVFGESTLALRQWMRQTGVKWLSADKEPEDHIGTMLLLMSWIAQNRPELLDEYLREHLLTWSSHFLQGMEEATNHSFYKGLARIARLSLEGIQKDHGIEVDYPRYYR